jgi:arylsulfatase A-like enzyme
MGGAPERAFVPDPARHRRIEPYAAPATFRRANVLVLMLESVPWSRLFGPLARRKSTPRLLALAAESTNFARAYATATHSDYAQTSILASLHPRRFDRHDFFADLSYPHSLPWDLLQPLGYRSAVFSCQNERWGNMIAFLKTPRLDLLRHSPDWPDAPRRGEGVESKVFESTPVESFLSWVAAAPERPFVAYLNFQATHYPYVVPPGEPEPYAPATIDFPTTFLSYPRDKIAVMENRFHNALAYVDRAVGRVVDGLAAAGAWENTILLVVSDHGEAFYEHGIPTHGSTLHEEQIRTAMFLRLPGEAPRTVAAPVSVLDALPTIFRFMGLPEPGNFQGRSDVLDPDYEHVAAAARAVPLTIQGMTNEDGLLLGDRKLIVNWDRGERVLFDLARDPDERRNLAAAEPAAAAALDRELTRLVLDQLAYYRERGWERGFYPPKLP